MSKMDPQLKEVSFSKIAVTWVESASLITFPKSTIKIKPNYGTQLALQNSKIKFTSKDLVLMIPVGLKLSRKDGIASSFVS